jgi:hypothetical protein
MKKIKGIIIIIASFGLGGYMLWLAYSILYSNVSLFEPNHSIARDGLPNHLRDENLRSLICSLIAGIGGFANGFWYLLKFKSLDDFE